MPTTLSRLPLDPTDPRVDRVRRAVVDAPGLATAFLYRRDDGDGPRPAVGLVGDPQALVPGSDAVAAVLEAWGPDPAGPPAVVALAPELEVLVSVIVIAPPLGAGGDLEVAVAEAALDARAADEPADLDLPAVARAVAAVVDGALVVPTDADGQGVAGPHGASLRLHLPVASAGGTRGVGAFTSLYAMVRSVGSHPATTMAGWALVEALPPDVHVVIDPGSPWEWAPPLPLLRRLSRRCPAGPDAAFAPR